MRRLELPYDGAMVSYHLSALSSVAPPPGGVRG